MHAVDVEFRVVII